MKCDGFANVITEVGLRSGPVMWTAKWDQIVSHKADPTHSRRTERNAKGENSKLALHAHRNIKKNDFLKKIVIISQMFPCRKIDKNTTKIMQNIAVFFKFWKHSKFCENLVLHARGRMKKTFFHRFCIILFGSILR